MAKQSKAVRIRKLLRTANTKATTKFGNGGIPKDKTPKPITLARLSSDMKQ
jgi:hypothetical protein